LGLTELPISNNYLLATPEEFHPHSEPTAADWKKFNLMTNSEKLKLWNHFSSRGINYAQWSWQWRIGWVRYCGNETESQLPCNTILKSGLKDGAVVVRAESAQAIGRKYQNRPDQSILNALENSFSDPRNVRNGTPLFVCDRILMAMKQMGGKAAHAKAKSLAKSFAQTEDYWKKINNQPTVKM
jgi:hypothetical protein